MALQAVFQAGAVSFAVDFSVAIDCSIAVHPPAVDAGAASPPNVCAWSVPPPSQESLAFDKYVLDTRRGGSCNANNLHVSFHTAGTHTECVGHITDERITTSHGRPCQALSPALVLSLQPEPLQASGETYGPGQPDDLVISARVLQAAVDAIVDGAAPRDPACRDHLKTCFAHAVVIRTLPNPASKRR